MLLSELTGGASPVNSARRWSFETIAFGCWSRIANSELLDPAERDRAPAVDDLKGAEYAEVHRGAPADRTAPRHTPPASSHPDLVMDLQPASSAREPRPVAVLREAPS